MSSNCPIAVSLIPCQPISAACFSNAIILLMRRTLSKTWSIAILLHVSQLPPLFRCKQQQFNMSRCVLPMPNTASRARSQLRQDQLELQANTHRDMISSIEHEFNQMQSTVEARASATTSELVGSHLLEIQSHLEKNLQLAVHDVHVKVDQHFTSEQDRAYGLRHAEIQQGIRDQLDSALAELRCALEARSRAVSEECASIQAMQIRRDVDARMQQALDVAHAKMLETQRQQGELFRMLQQIVY